MRFTGGEMELLRSTAKRYGCTMAYVLRQLISRSPMRYEYVEGSRKKVIDVPEVLRRIPKVSHDPDGAE